MKFQLIMCCYVKKFLKKNKTTKNFHLWKLLTFKIAFYQSAANILLFLYFFRQINNNGRLDLSFTKCRFPNDYLPYVSNGNNTIKDLMKKRSHSIDIVGSFVQDEHGESKSMTKTKHLDHSSQPRLESTFSMTSSSSSSSSTCPSTMFDADHDHHRQQNNDHRRRAFMWSYPFIPNYRPSWSCDHAHGSQSSKSYGLIRSCGCCLLIVLVAIILLSLSIVLGFSLYLAIVTNFLTEQTFAYGMSGNFRIVSGDSFTIRLLNQTSSEFCTKATRYERIVSVVFPESYLIFFRKFDH